MIKNLDGVIETVSFGSEPAILIHNNNDYEEYPIHWHTPVEIILPLEGGYNLTCNETPFSLETNDIIIIPPGVLHQLYATAGRRLIFQIDVSMLSMFNDFDAFFSFMQPAITISQKSYPTIHDYCVKLLLDAYDDYRNNTPLHNFSIISKILEMFVTIGKVYTMSPKRFSGVKPGKQKEYADKFIMICEYVNKNCTMDITLEETAEMAGFSKYHFSRLFKDFSGVSFYKYLNIRRIAVAEKLLLDPNISITEVGTHCGFNSISSFMRMFKIVKNCTPSQFRNFHTEYYQETQN